MPGTLQEKAYYIKCSLLLCSFNFNTGRLNLNACSYIKTSWGELAPAWEASAINYFLFCSGGGPTAGLSSLPTSNRFHLSLQSRFIHRHESCFFSLLRKAEHRGRKNSLKQKATQMTLLCSFNGLMNNCRRGDPAVKARSSVCAASLQGLHPVPLLIQLAKKHLIPILPSSALTNLCFILLFSVLLPIFYHKPYCVLAAPRLHGFPARLVSICCVSFLVFLPDIRLSETQG